MAAQVIAVADFGVGNLHSVVGALRRAAADAKIVLANDAETLARADKVILPGDGHFDACMRAITKRGLREVLLTAAATKPFWGICAGMQMLYESSEEGELPGLGIFAGRIRKLPQKSSGELPDNMSNGATKIPHIGWNTTMITKPQHPMLNGITDGARFYFIHSYYAAPDENTAATTKHGTTITAISAKQNIFASQFHPEKSATPGERLIKNFITP
ncbi:MAG: imidazole glycerol phosphate synthase subunit HisH [Gammaproteobacteria bacterium]